MTRRSITRSALAAACAATVLTSTAAGAGPAPGSCGGPTDVAPRCPTAPIAQSPDLPTYTSGIVADQSGRRVYVVGPDESGWTSFAGADVTTGRQLVHSSVHLGHFASDAGGGLHGYNAVITPDGRTVLGTGWLVGPDGYVPAVVAFDTSTGSLRWSWIGPDRHRADQGTGVVLDPRGTTLYVAIQQQESAASTADIVTKAFRVSDGRQLWQRSYGSPRRDDFPNEIHFAAGRVVVVGGVEVEHQDRIDDDAAALVYAARTGRLLGRVLADGGYGFDSAYAATNTPDGHGIVMTGPSVDDNSQTQRVLTVAVDVRKIRREWATRTAGSWPLEWAPGIMASGHRVVVAVQNFAADSTYEDPVGLTYGLVGARAAAGTFPTAIAFDLRTGKKLWSKDYPDPTHPSVDVVSAVGSRDGNRLYLVGVSSRTDASTYPPTLAPRPVPASPFVPGPSDGFAAAVDIKTGSLVWTSHYNADETAAAYATGFLSVAATRHGLVTSGFVDTRSRTTWAGTIFGTVARYRD